MNDAKDWVDKGIALGKLGKHEEAMASYDKAIEINPQYAEAWNNKGVALAESDKYEEAIACFNKAIGINPQYAEAWSNKGAALDASGKHGEAITSYDKAIEINSKLADAWYNKGNALGKLGKHEDAITCYDKAIKINPQDADAWNNKGVALDASGKHGEAITSYDKAIKIDPQDADAWNNKGNALGKLGKHEDAITCYDKAIKINPQLAVAWSNKGVALGELGKHEETITCYDKAIEIDPKFAEARYNKGVVLLKTVDVEGASKAFAKAHEIDPNNYKYWVGWITALYEEGELDRSLYICKKSIDFFKGKKVKDKKDEEAKNEALRELFHQKGVILMKEGQPDEGLIAFREASKFGNKQAQQAINQLRETKRDWWEWWFSDVMTVTYFWKFTNRHLFITLFILLHLAWIFYCFYLPPIKSIGGITLAFLGVASLIGLLLISGKALLGIALTEILIAMLISPLTLLTLSSFNKIPSASIENISKIWIWQIWIASLVVLIFILFHRNIARIKTPFVELEMPELKAELGISMPELKLG